MAKEKTWKALAIIFMILFGLLLIYNVWSVWYVITEENKINECHYDICESYSDALYEDNICSCFDYDVMGNLIIVKEKYVK